VRWAVVEATPRARLGAAAVAAAVYLFANVGQGPMPSRMNADAEQGLAHWLEREGRRPDALALYERLARETPASFDAWYGVAQLATALGQPDKARAALARIRGLPPELPDTALLLARAALGAGCGLEAEGFAARAAALDGGSDKARRLMAEAATLRATPGGSPAGGCPDRVFVVPLTLPS
jgi:tetratricopeptide (TPR) repeat protein